jgi:hypothetical protein
MALGGTTTFVDNHYIHVDRGAFDGTAESVVASGLRAVLGRAAVDTPIAPEPSARSRRPVAQATSGAMSVTGEAGAVGGRGARRSNRIAGLRCSPVTAMISLSSAPFSFRVAAKYRSRCTAAYSRKLGRVTDTSLDSEWVAVTSDLRPPLR